MTITDAIRMARRRSGMTQRELAGRAGVPQSTVGRIESGAIHPRADTVDKLLGALGVQLILEPRPGRGIDRTLIRRMLRLNPRERIEYATATGRAVDQIRRAASR